jgi:NTP pyrophosphatase (non-canonical NTP hydrolase)
MHMNVDLKAYARFVAAVTSEPSSNLTEFMNRLDELDGNYLGNGQHGPDVSVTRLLTAGIGLSSETGELNEIIKKIFFQGKELSADNVFHMKRELGDIAWYWIQACLALDLDPNEVIAENVTKLESRYPGGRFDVYHSENRQQGDL